MRRVLLPTDWDRFDYYAAKIRELGYDPFLPDSSTMGEIRWRVGDVTLETFTSLCVVRLPFELVPNVRRIRWTTQDFYMQIHFHLFIFLNSPLVSLQLDLRDLGIHQSGRWDPLPSPPPEPDPNAPVAAEQDENGEGSDDGEEDGQAEAAVADPAAAPPLDDPEELFPGMGPPPAANPPAAGQNAEAANPAPRPPRPAPEIPSFADDMYIVSTLKAVLEQCPNCKEITINTEQFDGLKEALQTFLHAAKDLRVFDVDLRDWDEEDLIYLASIPTLKETRMSLSSQDNSWITRVPAPVSFPALTHLKLDLPSLACATGLFLSWGFCKLEGLLLACTDRPLPGELHAFTSTLATSCSPTSLEWLLIFDNCRAGIRAERPVLGTDLYPLEVFSALTEFDIGLTGTYEITNADLAYLGSAWPKLEYLAIARVVVPGVRPPSLTFAGLGALVRSCPCLRNVSLSLDCTHDDLASAGPVPPNGRLQSIDLCYSLVREYDPEGSVVVARSLTTLFPNLPSSSVEARLPFPQPPRDWDGEDEAMAVDGEDGTPPLPPPPPPASASIETASEETHVTGEGAGEDPIVENDDDPFIGPAKLAGHEFWDTVWKQMETFALLKRMNLTM